MGAALLSGGVSGRTGSGSAVRLVSVTFSDEPTAELDLNWPADRKGVPPNLDFSGAAISTASMSHGFVSAGVRRGPDGLARAPGATRGRFYGTKVPPVSTAGMADCPGCQEMPRTAGRLRVAGQSDFRTRVSRTSESRQAGQPPFAARHRPAPRRHEPGINRKPVRRRHLQDRQACFSGILRWHSSRGFHNHAGACRRTPATGAVRPEPAKPATPRS